MCILNTQQRQAKKKLDVVLHSMHPIIDNPIHANITNMVARGGKNILLSGTTK